MLFEDFLYLYRVVRQLFSIFVLMSRNTQPEKDPNQTMKCDIH